MEFELYIFIYSFWGDLFKQKWLGTLSVGDLVFIRYI